MGEINTLKILNDRLSNLLNDPQPGLATWNMAVGECVRKIGNEGKLVTDKEPDYKPKINWPSLKCEEASMFSRETFIPCGDRATSIVWHNKDKRAYAMCFGCADHNVKNRGGIELAAKDKELIVIKTQLEINHEFDYKSDIAMLRVFLRKFIGRYFSKNENVSDEELKEISENKEVLNVLTKAISGEFYEIEVPHGESTVKQ